MKPLNKIMVVEDEADIVTIIKYSLEKIGHFTVKYCNSGKIALQEIETFMPELILLDMMLPEMDGLTILAALHKKPAIAHIPVIFMTARSQPEEVKHYLKAGAIGVITKPFDPLTLPEKIKEIYHSNETEANS